MTNHDLSVQVVVAIAIGGMIVSMYLCSQAFGKNREAYRIQRASSLHNKAPEISQRRRHQHRMILSFSHHLIVCSIHHPTGPFQTMDQVFVLGMASVWRILKCQNNSHCLRAHISLHFDPSGSPDAPCRRSSDFFASEH